MQRSNTSCIRDNVSLGFYCTCKPAVDLDICKCLRCKKINKILPIIDFDDIAITVYKHIHVLYLRESI